MNFEVSVVVRIAIFVSITAFAQEIDYYVKNITCVDGEVVNCGVLIAMHHLEPITVGVEIVNYDATEIDDHFAKLAVVNEMDLCETSVIEDHPIPNDNGNVDVTIVL